MYTVYVRVDENGIITNINSDMFIKDFSGWVPVERGNGYAFMHAQNNYLSKPLRDIKGSANYKYIDGKIMPRSEEEKSSDNTDYVPDYLVRLSRIESAIEKINSLLNKLGMK